MNITFIYTFRERDVLRIKKSLESLNHQKLQNFDVIFIDYGSEEFLAEEVKKLVESYTFTKYFYAHTYYQPWNKCRAINFALKETTSKFSFIADVDMIFKDNFTTYLNKIANPEKLYYFQVGYLSKQATENYLSFDKTVIQVLSGSDATGLSFFSTEKLISIGGFDEFYHFWGAEDTDMHVRMANYGVDIIYDDTELFLIHQYHDSFHRILKEKQATFIPNNIVEINHQNLEFAKNNKITKVNLNNKIGKLPNKNDLIELEKSVSKRIKLTNLKSEVDFFIEKGISFYVGETIELEIIESFKKDSKYYMRKVFKKKNKTFYTINEVFSVVCKYIIFHKRYSLYSFDNSKYSIKLTLKLV